LDLLDASLKNLYDKLQIDDSDIEYKKFKHLITVTNQAYLKIAINELSHIKKENPTKNIISNFDFLMKLYNKHLREHQVMFLLLNIFETAIRSKAVIILSSKYSTSHTDDWLFNDKIIPKKIKRPLEEAIKKIKQDKENESKFNSFEIFDYIMLGQLQSIYLDFWSDLSYLFEEKTINNKKLNKIGKNSFKNLFDEIRKSRNDNAHHKPLHKTRKRRYQIINDIELILTHIGFNLNEAINNIDPTHMIIKYK
jgi:hypothetical protein